MVAKRAAPCKKETVQVEVWPAIDIRGGKCVRLIQGDFDRELVFAEDPVAMAQHWIAHGARRLHVVDLDAAKTGSSSNREIIAEIVRQVNVPVQVGGGIRDDRSIEELLALGVTRLVVGTAAVKRPDWFRQACQRWPGRLVLGIDARDGLVATDGWCETSAVEAIRLAQSWTQEPIAGIVYTDIATDGMLCGPNVDAMRKMQQAVSVPVIASGGVRSCEDVKMLAEAGLAGCIVGRALYEGTVRLEDLLHAAGDR